MHYSRIDILVAAAILTVDLVAWRCLGSRLERLRLTTRVVSFCALTYVLLKSGMNPFGPSPWAEERLTHFFAQCVELLWWLQVAKVASALLDRAGLPEAWKHERLFRDVLSALIFIAAGVAAIAYVLEIPVKGLLATSGAMAVVLGLAIQSTLGDVFSGVVLNATQPFQIGDWVFIGDVEGEIVESDWRATSLLNPQGNIVVVPNSVAAKANIVNHSRPPRMHGVSIVLEIAPEEQPSKVIEALEHAAAGAIDVLTKPQPVVKVKRATASSIQYEIVGYVDNLSKKTETRNTLFDLAQRHLAASGIHLRSLTVSDVRVELADRKERLLRHVDMFDTLLASQLSTLAQAVTSEDFLPGQIISGTDVTGRSPRDESQSLQIVAKGVATLFTVRGGKEIELRRMSPGDSIGQSGILSGGDAEGSMRAITPVTLCSLNREALTPILQQRPEIAKQMCRILAKRLISEQSALGLELAKPEEAEGFLDRLRDGIRRLHDLVLHEI